MGLLGRLAKGRRLFGNAPATVLRLKEPQNLVSLLDSLGIPAPAVRFDPPSDPRGWLVKQAGGAGGGHVRRAQRGTKPRPGRYFQRFVAGRSLSSLFVADGRHARLIGFSEQWPAGADCPRRPFSFGGAISDAPIPAATRAQVEDWGARLTACVGLVGLNGIDFILDEAGRPHCLEINPRPTATAELYDDRAEGGLFAWHLQACDGQSPKGRLESGAVRGQAVVYAPAPFTIPMEFRWSAWVGRSSGSRDAVCVGCAGLHRACRGTERAPESENSSTSEAESYGAMSCRLLHDAVVGRRKEDMNVSERAADAARARPSINAAAQPLVEALVREAESLRVGVATHPGGCRIVDAGIESPRRPRGGTAHRRHLSRWPRRCAAAVDCRITGRCA